MRKQNGMWYLLNKVSKIQVKTTHGITDEEDDGDFLGQGTVEAGLVSAANLGEGLQK